jgi:hypothetical protein
VPDTVVEGAFAASLWAPNHKLTFPWAYFWTGPETRRQLAELNVKLKSEKEALSDIKRQAARDNILNPSHFVLLATKLTDPKREHEDYATLACSVQIAALYLWEHGIGSKWSTGLHSKHAETYKILGISPEQYRLEGALMIGVPQIMPHVPARPPLAEFMRRLK